MFKIIAAIVAALIVAIIIVVALMLFTSDQGMQKAANLATVVVSFFACGLFIVTTGLVAAVLALISVITTLIERKVNPLIDKVEPLLDKANGAVDTAKGTVTYVGEGVVSPLIKVSSILAAVKGGVNALFRNRNV